MSLYDWDAIEAEYIAGVLSNRKIAEKYGCSESGLRKKAKQEGWMRDPAGKKAALVREKLVVGDTRGAANEIFRQAIEQDVADMNLGLENARKVLHKVSKMIPLSEDGRELKTLSEAVKINIELIRKIRGLDDDVKKEDDLENWSESQLRAELDRLGG